MDFSGINLVAVAVATIASFAFGALYYTVLGRAWMDGLGKTEEDFKGARTATPFVVALLGLLIMASVLSALLAGQGMDMLGASQAIGCGIAVWLGFIVTSMAINNAFQAAKAKLTLIDTGHWLGVVVIQSVALSVF